MFRVRMSRAIATILVLAAVIVAAQVTRASPDSSAPISRAQAYGRLPLSFEPNRGQVDPQVKFLSHGSDHTLFLTATEAVLQPSDTRCAQSAQIAGAQSSGGAGKPKCHKPATVPAALRMQIVGANAEPRTHAEQQQPGVVNYYRGRDPSQWKTAIPTFGRVRYDEVYDGIDLLYYGNTQRLEYDFIVAPGADPKRIVLRFEGAERIELDSRGNLILRSAGRETLFRKPVAYQETDGGKKEIQAAYALRRDTAADGAGERNVVSFEVRDYDHGKSLIVDPVLEYSTFLGGDDENGDSDSGSDIAVGDFGFAFVAGQTNSETFPTAFPFQPSIRGGVDVFVTKLNPSGTALVYSTYLGGDGHDYKTEGGLAVSGGSAFVAGTTYGSGFPVTPDAFDSVQESDGSAFIAILDPAGALTYSTLFGTIEPGQALVPEGLAVRATSPFDGVPGPLIYVAGWVYRADGVPITADALQPTRSGDYDGFASALAPSNPAASQLLYSTYLGGESDDKVYAIAADASGIAYLTGSTESADFPTKNPLQAVYAASEDGFVTKLDPAPGLAPASQLVYSTYLGSNRGDVLHDIAVNSAGDVFVAGYSASPDLPMVNAFQSSLNGIADDAYVARINPAKAPAAQLVYSTYLGGTNTERAYDMAISDGGNIYLTGTTYSSDFPTVAPLTQASALPGDRNAFVVHLSPALAPASQLVFSSYLGGGGSDYGFGIARTDDRRTPKGSCLYVTGSTESADFPVTKNALQPTLGGDEDAFVAKICPARLVELAVDIREIAPLDLFVTSEIVVAVTNTGPATATNVRLDHNAVGLNTDFMVVDLLADEGACELTRDTRRSTAFRCTFDSIPTGVTAEVRLLVKPLAGGAPGDGIQQSARVATAGKDLDRRNNKTARIVTFDRAG